MGTIYKNGINYSGSGTDLPSGGTAGQVLAKKTNTDRDVEWIDPPDGVVDTEMSGTSENAVQNKVIKNYVDGLLDDKQDVLTAGDGIKIENNEISGASLSASKGETNSVELTDIYGTKLGVEFGDDIVMSASSPMLFNEERTLQEKLTAGDGIAISNNTISADEVFVATYEQTLYADIVQAISANKVILVDMPNNNNLFCMTYSSYVSGGDVILNAIYKLSSGTTSLMTVTVKSTDQWSVSHTQLQDNLESGTNIKTINNQSIIGSGNIDVDGGKIDVIKVNGITQAITNKTVDLNVPQYEANSNAFSAYGDNAEFSLQISTNGMSATWVEGSDSVEKEIVDKTYTDSFVTNITGALTDLTTDNQSNLVAAINEVYEKSGEPFRVKQWKANNLNLTFPSCVSNIGNGSIPKLVFKITGQEATDYQIVGMIAYEVFDASGTRLNFMPVCQFTGVGQTELSVRGCVMGETDKVAQSISAWVLLKHR